MLLAEDLLLLLTDDVEGKLMIQSTQADIALGGANLVELTLMQRVDVDARKRLVVRDPSPTGDQILDTALQTVATKQGKKPKAAVTPLGKNLRPALYARLTEQGLVRPADKRVLGLFPAHRWVSTGPGHESGVRDRVVQALTHGITPDERTAALVALLHALKIEHRVVPPAQYGLRKSELRARAKQVAQGDWASEAVRQAIDDMMAAITAATVAATAGAGAASS